jgi:hypothetical protein
MPGPLTPASGPARAGHPLQHRLHRPVEEILDEQADLHPLLRQHHCLSLAHRCLQPRHRRFAAAAAAAQPSPAHVLDQQPVLLPRSRRPALTSPAARGSGSGSLCPAAPARRRSPRPSLAARCLSQAPRPPLACALPPPGPRRLSASPAFSSRTCASTSASHAASCSPMWRIDGSYLIYILTSLHLLPTPCCKIR